MNKQRFLLMIVFSLLVIPTISSAKDKPRIPNSDPTPERVRIQPEGLVPSKLTPPERGTEPATQPNKDLIPVRHIWGDVDRDGLEDLFISDRGETCSSTTSVTGALMT